MRLVACQQCHNQYDVSNIQATHIDCACGGRVGTTTPSAVDRDTHRCSSCGAQVAPTDDTCEYCSASLTVDLAQGTLICPECFSRNGDSASFCNSCGVRFAPIEAMLDGGAVTCPACEVLMSQRAIGAVPVNECGTCLGLWVPGSQLDGLLRRAAEAHAARVESGNAPVRQRSNKSGFSSKITYRRCPICSTQMARRNFDRRSGVIVDQCSDHGTWLDADELEDIAQYVMHSHRQQATVERADHVHVSGDTPASVKSAELFMAQERYRQEQRRERRETGFSLGSLGEFLSDLLS